MKTIKFRDEFETATKVVEFTSKGVLFRVVGRTAIHIYDENYV